MTIETVQTATGICHQISIEGTPVPACIYVDSRNADYADELLAAARLFDAAPLVYQALAYFIEFAKEDGWQNWTPRRQALLRDGIDALAAAGGSDGNQGPGKGES